MMVNNLVIKVVNKLWEYDKIIILLYMFYKKWLWLVKLYHKLTHITIAGNSLLEKKLKQNKTTK